ncbi:MAG: penicillin-binding protein 2 [Armatimonadetes bacterium]|nr:penicillin-binding protein 2 [Armatimonadota bacterium]
MRLRVSALFVLLAVSMVGLGARLVSLHVVQASALEEMAERQQLGTLVLDPRRGRLLDRSGRPLAVNVDAPSVFAAPSKIADPDAFAGLVAPVLGMPGGDLAARLPPDRHFVWLARKVAPDVAARLAALQLGEQLGFVTEARRVYPNGSLAAYVVGFAGIDNQGLAGAELAFDATLRGRRGLARVERDAMGRPRFETREVVREPTDGADVVLTIDEVVQHIAERELDRAVAETRAKWGTVLVMDLRTGEMLAMAAAPRFDPNAYRRVEPARWTNPALLRIVEPGSVFKIVLAAAALESGAVDPEEVFVNDGILKVGGHVIKEAHNRKYRRQTLGDIIRNSSNVGAAMVATRLGKERFYQAIRRFGFGEPTGIDLPGEAAGLVPPPAQWLGPGLQTIAFGQGVSATPLQMLAAAAALANDGVLVRPRILRAVRDPEGRAVRVTAPEVVRQVTPPAVARAVMGMMEGVVARGTGTQARIDGYRVAGKTGTAQKPSPTGGYQPDAYLSSFVGIVPSNHPQLAILVMLDEPQGAYFGGAVAAPVFRSVAAPVLWHLRVPPSAAQVLTR